MQELNINYTLTEIIAFKLIHEYIQNPEKAPSKQ